MEGGDGNANDKTGGNDAKNLDKNKRAFDANMSEILPGDRHLLLFIISLPELRAFFLR